MLRTAFALVMLLSACGRGNGNTAVANSDGGNSFSKTQRIAEDREIYAAAANPNLADSKIAADAKLLCKVGADWCMVVVVRNGTQLPTGFPMTDVEAAKALGFYTLNRTTGMDEFKRQGH